QKVDPLYNITVIPDRDMRIFLRKTKHDRDALGQEFIVPALIELCPVRAYTHWLEDSGIHYGPVFRPITRWGRMADEGLSSSAIGPILRRVAEAAGVEQRYTSHSFRHGFANWAIDEGWDLISMMRYVGWKSVQNAQGYVQPKFNFGKLAIGQPASLSAPRWEPGHGEVFPGIVERLEDDE
ncbi:tyrosine-type recombinase/integrase, partial [Pseudomonas aeruginosa]